MRDTSANPFNVRSRILCDLQRLRFPLLKSGIDLLEGRFGVLSARSGLDSELAKTRLKGLKTPFLAVCGAFNGLETVNY